MLVIYMYWEMVCADTFILMHWFALTPSGPASQKTDMSSTCTCVYMYMYACIDIYMQSMLHVHVDAWN